MRGIGQLALRSTDPPRVAEFYESAFGFRRLAGDEAGVDLELGGFELSFRHGEAATRDGLQIGFKVDTASEVDAWAQELGSVASRSWRRHRATTGRARAASGSPTRTAARSPCSTTTRADGGPDRCAS